MTFVSIREKQMATLISKTEHLCQLDYFLYGLCKDEREKLAEKQQKARPQVTLTRNNLLQSSLTQSWEKAEK